MHGIVIAGTHSGCGKTTVTLGILAALREKGLQVQSFKTGPDFIDAGLHRIITGRPSRNLDIWMCGAEEVAKCFSRHTGDADIAVVEGVMGMYDGDFSTASLACLLDLPVVLVVDAYGMAESAAAVVKGFMTYDSPAPFFAGVIFNRVASESHFKRLKECIRDVPVLGYLPRDLDFEIPHRHLGLATAEESPLSNENIKKLAGAILKHIDIDTLIKREEGTTEGSDSPERPPVARPAASSRLSLAVAYDRAFCFYYEDNLDALRDAGIDIVTFSPLADPLLPDRVDGIYIGGGYPELYAEALSGNTSLLSALRDWSCEGKPLYAECGGLMYLSQGIYDFEGAFFPMTGILPFPTQMKKGRARLGYREIVLEAECILGKKGSVCRGHEFHYSEIREDVKEGGNRDAGDRKCPGLPEEKAPEPARIYSVRDRTGRILPGEGYRVRTTLASYIHVHFGSNADIAESFAHFIQER
ncbi:MAG: cobyrinate a,c-diamide synthase [Alphaproteobacteria bacterium]|uniref:Cobyrinate a,c-diamide synthase n=1 Tax=Candidatus Nitrobium versatile TaxID=2884831 RepID=A0A953M3F1_9BACT|nr:cobyrinate a,c-diamide synthase [Candidatus Nitrobium versatile]